MVNSGHYTITFAMSNQDNLGLQSWLQKVWRLNSNL